MLESRKEGTGHFRQYAEKPASRLPRGGENARSSRTGTRRAAHASLCRALAVQTQDVQAVLSYRTVRKHPSAEPRFCAHLLQALSVREEERKGPYIHILMQEKAAYCVRTDRDRNTLCIEGTVPCLTAGRQTGRKKRSRDSLVCVRSPCAEHVRPGQGPEETCPNFPRTSLTI